MGMISRDWCCLNGRCRSTFHSFEDAPTCPSCGNVRVHWIPGGGHVGKVAGPHDKRLQFLADKYGMTNLNSPSPSRLNRAAPRAEHPDPSSIRGQYTFAPGFTANIYHKASCEPSLVRNDLKGTTVNIGTQASPFSQSKTVSNIRENTVTVARHRGIIR
jgi:hypothetical protein